MSGVPRGGRLCACGDHVFAAATRGFVFLIAPDDAGLLVRKWTADVGSDGYVGIYNGGRPRRSLARVIAKAPAGVLVDHKNRDTMDNRRNNLRLASHSQNQQNKKPVSGKVLPKGVCRVRRKFGASIRINKVPTWLGVFETPEEAAQAYRSAALKHHGEFARFE